MEAWKFAGNGVRKGFIMLLEQIWAEGDIPKNWKTSIIVLYIKEERKSRWKATEIFHYYVQPTKFMRKF